MTPETQQAVEELAKRRLEHIELLRTHPDGVEWCVAHTDIVDEVVRLILKDLAASQGTVAEIAIVATGGYGRRELAPYSDVDLTVVPLDEAQAEVDSTVRAFFKDLHAAIGTSLKMDVGYAYRLVNDAPGLDAKTRTSLLDARLVAGASAPFEALMDLYWETFPVGEFLLEKIRERESNFNKYNDTPLAVVPHIKEGAGGLRSFHCANWLRAAIGERASRGDRSFDHILCLRNMLHLVSGKRNDLLTHQRQGEIADLMGLDIYALMSQATDSALELHREYELALGSLHESRFWLGGGVMAIRGEARVSGEATLSSAAAGIALATQLNLRVPDIPTATSGQMNGTEALFAVATGEATIRNLERCGLLEGLLPELTACKTLIPRDNVHAFTVFEHTLRVIRNLDSLTPGTFLGDLKAAMPDHDPLYLAALLHDVGKLRLDKPHSETGAEIAEEVTKRWKLAPKTAELVVWLVREHLTMSRFIRMRDVLNPQTTADFLAIVGDQQRLDMLTIFTWADVEAVGDGVWGPVQESFLRELHERTMMALQNETPHVSDPTLYRKRLIRELKKEQFSEEQVNSFLDSLPSHYLLSTPPDLVKLHMFYEGRARQGEPTIDLEHQPELGATEITVCTRDEHALLSKLLGVFYAFDLSVHSIRAGTTRTDVPVALDVFTLSFGGRPIPQATALRITNALREVLTGAANYEDLLRKSAKDPHQMQHSYTYTFVEGVPGILEVRAPRGSGMAFRFSRLIAERGWNITAARVGQWAGRGAAAFYVLGSDDRPLTKAEVNAALSVQV